MGSYEIRSLLRPRRGRPVPRRIRGLVGPVGNYPLRGPESQDTRGSQDDGNVSEAVRFNPAGNMAERNGVECARVPDGVSTVDVVVGGL